MDRVARLGVWGLLAGLIGCTPTVRYVEQGNEGGVVAIPERSNDWPTFYRDRADELIAKHVGSEYVVTEEWSEKTGECLEPPCALKRVAGEVTGDPTEWRIRYRKASDRSETAPPTPPASAP
jgi:hypothetical protein